MRARSSVFPALAALAALALPATAATLAPEVHVNTRYDSKQKLPAVAFDRAGGSVVVWSHDRDGLLARFYRPSGEPQGGEVLLVENQNLLSLPSEGEVAWRREPAAVFGTRGDLFVFWTEERGLLRADVFWEDYQVLSRAVFAQRFEAPSGRPLGQPFRVSARNPGLSARPAVGVRGDRMFVVWHSEHDGDAPSELDAIFGRLLDRNGGRVGQQFRIDTRPGVAPLFPSVAFNPAGEALVAWEGCCEISRTEIYGRAFDAAGAPVGADFRVNSKTASWQRRPAVAAAGDGGFLVAWQGSLVSAGQGRIFGQRVSSRGDLLGAERQLSTADPAKRHGHYAPALQRTQSGGFFLVWVEWFGATPVALYASELDAAGAPTAARIRLSHDRVMLHHRVGLAADGQGGFVVAWEGKHGRPLGISARRLTAR